ncbi:MAG: hypothetical protein ABIW76_22020 [Fibrobacteria bacterium]
MNIGKIITSASLAIAILGGIAAFAPASVEAAAKKSVVRCHALTFSCKSDHFNKPGFDKREACQPGRGCPR